MSDEIRHGEIDAVIDIVARRMTAGDPGPGFRVRVLDGIASATTTPAWRRVGLAAAAALLAVCAGVLAWRLAVSPTRDPTETAGRVVPPAVTEPLARPTESPLLSTALPTAVASHETTTREAAARAWRPRPARIPVLAGQLAERMAAEPGALQLGTLPVPTSAPLALVAVEAVAVAALGLDPLEVEAIDGNGAKN
jgi:hypothetical protein